MLMLCCRCVRRCLFFLGFVDPRMILLRLPGVETAVEQDQAEA